MTRGLDTGSPSTASQYADVGYSSMDRWANQPTSAAQAAHRPPPSVPMPDMLLLICPVLNLNRSPSPSRVAFCSDTLLPQPLLAACAKAYDGGQVVGEEVRCMRLCGPLHALV